eukprot:TRINITY_DN38709_c0_g2_i1.p1 TRINITY_DN38709_c0_g2~~TRINITY_DN38709_c0_g2_i1.p1  ORF type:complete len:695 (-),score=119.84 TRINITY_DN38709_c0_g2_i1:441-2525(-)
MESKILDASALESGRMDSRVCVSAAKLHAVQQALESGMRQQRHELLTEIRAILEQTCWEHHEMTIRRVQDELLRPQLLSTHAELEKSMQCMQKGVNGLFQNVAKFATQLANVDSDIVGLKATAEAAASRIEYLHAKAESNAKYCKAVDLELHRHTTDLREETAAESRRREDLEVSSKALFEDARGKAAAAKDVAKEFANAQFLRATSEGPILEERLIKYTHDRSVEMLEDAKNFAEHRASSLQAELHSSEQLLLQGLAKSEEQAATLVNDAVEGFDFELAATSKILAKAGECFAERTVREFGASLAVELEDARSLTLAAQEEARSALQNTYELLNEDINVSRCEATSEAVALRSSVNQAQQACAQVRRELQTERWRTENFSSDAARLNKQRAANLEVNLEKEVVCIRQSLFDLQTKLKEQGDAWCAEIRSRPTSCELSEISTFSKRTCTNLASTINENVSRLEATDAYVSARLSSTEQAAVDVGSRQQREIITLGTEVARLRAASTSLTNGVVKALHVLGLVHDDIFSPASATDSNSRRNAGVGNERCDGSSSADVRQRRVEVEDLLLWEKAGRSLASRVGQTWQRNDPASDTRTVLAAVDQKADSHELHLLKVLVDKVLQKLASGPVARTDVPLSLEAFAIEKLSYPSLNSAAHSCCQPTVPRSSLADLPPSVMNLRHHRAARPPCSNDEQTI